ncbi:MAG: TldD/PmbA family protein [Nocardioidaceae bacterium]|nr:TldD/PmbA family protein [Nocardioidaceae bacterium]
MPSNPSSSNHAIDPEFEALPLSKLAETALSRARDFDAAHADFRVERLRSQHLSLRDGRLVDASQGDVLGFCVRVIVDGAWGFAAGVGPTTDAVVRVTEQAISVARAARPIVAERIELAEEPVYADQTWVSEYDIDPFTVSVADKVGLLEQWSHGLLAATGVDHVSAVVRQVRENKFYADSHGTTTVQQRVRLAPELEVYGADAKRGVIDSMRTIAPPVGRGWEYLTGELHDWSGELAALPELLAEKLAAPSVTAGHYDLVIHPSNLWLTIHESIGHATELDRVLGYEANYAGTSFAKLDGLGSLRYGSRHLNVTGDRTVRHGLATIGYDDDGVVAQQWDLIKDGILVGYQTDRRMAKMMGWRRSNGCAYADSSGHVPIQRMANVSIAPSPDPVSTHDLLSQVEDGLYVVGDRSWSIDMQRYNFQFTGQRFHQIKNGELRGQVRDAAYQGTTTDFWGAMEAVGGEETWELNGAFNCGKAQPGQVAAVSHGCPSALFRDISILNTTTEAGR